MRLRLLRAQKMGMLRRSGVGGVGGGGGAAMPQPVTSAKRMEPKMRRRPRCFLLTVTAKRTSPSVVAERAAG
jgi:hypothetical protein